MGLHLGGSSRRVPGDSVLAFEEICDLYQSGERAFGQMFQVGTWPGTK
jgi:hypothetical protein